MSEARRFHWFAYMASDRERRERRGYHQERDTLSFALIGDALHAGGLERGDVIFNHAAQRGARPAPITFAQNPQDLMLLTTRPPLDDRRAKAKKAIETSGSALENYIHSGSRRMLEYCSRTEVSLSPAMEGLLPSSRQNLASATFCQYESRERWGSLESSVAWEEEATDAVPIARQQVDALGYLIHVPSAVTGGAAILSVFGMSGEESLAWVYLLTTRFPDLVPALVDGDHGRLVIAGMKGPEQVELLPTLAEFGRDWSLCLLADLPLPAA